MCIMYGLLLYAYACMSLFIICMPTLTRYDKGHIKSARISSTNVRYANFMYVTTKIFYENKDCQFMVFSIECKASTVPHRNELHCIHMHYFVWPVRNL